MLRGVRIYVIDSVFKDRPVHSFKIIKTKRKYQIYRIEKNSKQLQPHLMKLWSWQLFHFPADYCYGTPCKNGATCMSLDTTYSCMCDCGFYGTTCDTCGCIPGKSLGWHQIWHLIIRGERIINEQWKQRNMNNYWVFNKKIINHTDTVQTFNSCTSWPDVCQWLVVKTHMNNLSKIVQRHQWPVLLTNKSYVQLSGHPSIHAQVIG